RRRRGHGGCGGRGRRVGRGARIRLVEHLQRPRNLEREHAEQDHAADGGEHLLALRLGLGIELLLRHQLPPAGAAPAAPVAPEAPEAPVAPVVPAGAATVGTEPVPKTKASITSSASMSGKRAGAAASPNLIVSIENSRPFASSPP